MSYITAHELDRLRTFDTATSQQLAECSLLRRTDTKFVLPRTQLARVLDKLQPHFRLVYSRECPVASYRNLYFDTKSQCLYHMHRNGMHPRFKVRIRQYVERELSFMELKRKDERDVTSKIRRKRAFRSADLTSDDLNVLATELGQGAGQLTPSLRIDFPRITMVGKHTHERITLDVGLAVHGAGQHIAMNHLLIAELKRPVDKAQSYGAQTFAEIGASPTRFSKYCAAIEACGMGANPATASRRIRIPVRRPIAS